MLASFDETLSWCVWRLDWASLWPLQLSGGLRAGPIDADEALAFVAAHYAEVFQADTADRRFLPDPMTDAKRRFFAASDRIAFFDGDRVVGLLVGNPVDWSTYYWRTVALLPAYQGRGLLAQVLRHTDALMRAHGVVRVEGECAPTNYRQLRLLLRLGYVVTSTVTSERWGALLRLTRFLNEEAEEAFAERFSKDAGLPRSPSSPSTSRGERHEEVRDHVLLSPTQVSCASRVAQ